MSYRSSNKHSRPPHTPPGSGGDSDHEWRLSSSDRDRDHSKIQLDRPPKEFSSDPSRTLFIGRLNPDTTEETLRKYFDRFGDIDSLCLIKDILTGESRRYAFCEFHRAKDADRAYADGHNTIIDGRRILVDREFGRTMKGWKPRRAGGGFGGFKESGQIRFGGRTFGASGGSDYNNHHNNNNGNGFHHQQRQEYRPRPSFNNNNNSRGFGGSSNRGGNDRSGYHPYSRDSGNNSTGLRRPAFDNFTDNIRSRMHGQNSGGYGRDYNSGSSRGGPGPIRSSRR